MEVGLVVVDLLFGVIQELSNNPLANHPSEVGVLVLPVVVVVIAANELPRDGVLKVSVVGVEVVVEVPAPLSLGLVWVAISKLVVGSARAIPVRDRPG
jgi:hypothetical protein